MRDVRRGERRGKREISIAKGKGGIADTQEQLLIAASDLMIERGIADITLNDISVRSGLNSALVKYYFGSKSGLMLALLRKSLTRSISDLRHLSEMSKSPTEKLRIHISGIVNTYSRHPYINRVIHRLISEDAEIFEPLIVEEFLRPVAEAQRRIIGEGVDAGIFTEIDAKFFYSYLTGACEQRFFGIQHLDRLFEVDNHQILLTQEFANSLYKIVLSGILAPTQQT